MMHELAGQNRPGGHMGCWNTALTRDYGLEYPFVGAGMGFLSMPPLVSAVSNAGGLGLLGVAPLPAEAMVDLVQQTRALGDGPFGVDLIHETTAFGPSTTEAHIDACVESRVDVVLFFWHQPPEAWVDRLKSAGTRVWMTVGSLAAAREADAAGMDALVLQGSEAGGHNRSRLALTSLVPAVKDALPGMTCIAAGGIADGRGVAAALMLGADGVCVGTRLIASAEATAHETYKARVIAADVDEIVSTTVFGPEWPDQPMKVIANAGLSPPPAQSEAGVIGTTRLGGQEYPMPRCSAVLPTPDTTGDFEQMCLAAGESAGLVHEVQPAGDIVAGMMAQAEHLLRAPAGLKR